MKHGRMQRINKCIFWLMALIAITLQVGCEKKQEKFNDVFLDANLTLKNDKEQKLAQTFQEYWHYRSVHELKKSYGYELPAYRYINDFDRYKSQASEYNHDFNTTLVGIAYPYGRDDVAEVARRYAKDSFTGKYTDKWVYVNGAWYHEFNYSPFPF